LLSVWFSVVVFSAGFQHLFELNDYRDHDLLLLGLIHVDVIFVMDRNSLLANGCNGRAFFIQKIEVQSDDIALKLPSQPFAVYKVYTGGP